ncbi:MAG: trigger factor [Streptococcaceae bacterium]|jgi:trigger factor|nr:trigger factor [Streptococcaceae bacterium]
MTASFEKTGKTVGTLTFTIGAELQKKGLDAAFNKQKKNIQVPGFRKGKISREMFERMFGEEALYNDALNAVLQEAYAAALKETGVEPVAQPQVDVKSMDKGADWELTAEVTTKPEVKLGKYEGLSVAVDVEKEATDADVEARLKAEQNKLAEMVVKDGKAETGDTVVIDFDGSVDGVAFEGGKGSNHSLELGSGQFIPGFEDQLVGHKSGDEVEVKVTFPEDYQASDLAGKEAIFATTVHEVKGKELPEIDDELAKDIDEEVETLEALKEKFRKEIVENKEEEYQDALESAAIEAAVENADIDEIPESMIHEEVHRAMNEFLGQMQQQGINPEMYYQITGQTEDDLHAQYAEDAEKRVKTNLVIEAIAADKDFTVASDDIDAEIADLAKQYGMDVKQVAQMLPRDMIEHDVKMKKAVEVITESAKVK